jgi:hypothetical protein
VRKAAAKFKALAVIPRLQALFIFQLTDVKRPSFPISRYIAMHGREALQDGILNFYNTGIKCAPFFTILSALRRGSRIFQTRLSRETA